MHAGIRDHREDRSSDARLKRAGRGISLTGGRPSDAEIGWAIQRLVTALELRAKADGSVLSCLEDGRAIVYRLGMNPDDPAAEEAPPPTPKKKRSREKPCATCARTSQCPKHMAVEGDF
jgi:hypothetical protein